MDFGSSHLVPSPVSISRSQRTAPSQVAANKLAAGGGASGLWFDHARYDAAGNDTRVVSSNANGTDVSYTFDAGGLKKIKLRGLDKVGWLVTYTAAA
jgi:hypothetical protein